MSVLRLAQYAGVQRITKIIGPTQILKGIATMKEDLLATLVAKDAIRDLPIRYCDYVWQDDIDGIVKLFAPNGSFTAVYKGNEKTATGREELRAFFVGGLGIHPRPFIHNHVIDLHDQATASGRCYLDLRSARHDMGWIGAGYYQDEYVKSGDQWRFKSRRFTALRIDDLPEGFSEE